ncbi:AAA family ATPase, partial [bacterium]|nr:AAA family ATPase [bacterium]
FLTEMDGIEELKGVVVLAATNRFDMMDPAVLRPGRFDIILEMPIPDKKTRLEIFKIHAKDKPLAKDVSPELLVGQSEGFTGADIEAILRQASSLAIREFLEKVKGKPDKKAIEELTIKKKHFDEAIKTINVKK